MVQYRFTGKAGRLYETYFEDVMKLNFNCPQEYKDGEGQGSCKGYRPGSEKSEDKSSKASKPSTTNTKSTDFTSIDKNAKAAFYGMDKASIQDVISKDWYVDKLFKKHGKTLGLSKEDIRKHLLTLVSNTSTETKPEQGPKSPNKELSTTISETKKLIEKAKQEKKSGAISKETKKELSDSVNAIKKLSGTEKPTTKDNTNKLSELYIVKNNKQLFNNINLDDPEALYNDSKSSAEDNLSKTQYNQLLEMERYLELDPSDSSHMVRNTLSQLKKQFYKENEDTGNESSVIRAIFDESTFFILSKINAFKGPEEGDYLKWKKLHEGESKPVKDFVDKSKENLTGYEKYFNAYSDIQYEDINKVLCGEDCSTDLSDINEFHTVDTIRNMIKAFDNSSTQDELTVYRGVSKRQIDNLLGDITDLNDLVGKEIEQPVFASTSRNQNTANEFAKYKKGYVYEITLPKGSHAIAMDTVSQYPDEMEVLLDMNSKLTIESVDTSKNPPVLKMTCHW